MASFIGTYDEFTKFISPRARNTVNSISRNYKTTIGKCEHCEATESLEAAHIKGRERPRIIEEILKGFTNGDIITVDLEVFENKFIAAHQPIEKVIKVLCRPCHRKYDALQVEALENSDLEADIPIISNSEVTDFFRQKGTLFSAEVFSNLQSLEYCNSTFGLHFKVLKEVPKNSNLEEIRNYARINGYNRWSTQRPIERDNYIYLVVTQWFEPQRARFVVWKNKLNISNH